MKEFKNEFAWSVSKQRNFDECHRLYYFASYAHWGGWDKFAPELARKCYLFTKMTNLDLWCGQIVHEVIRETLDKIAAQQPVSLPPILSRAESMFYRGWKQSVDKLWQNNPKYNVNLFEHYYNIPIPEERVQQIKTRMRTCLTNLWEDERFIQIRQSNSLSWKPYEQFDKFDFDGIPIWVKLDFAMTENDGWLHIYDWKTGTRRENVPINGDEMDNTTQLGCYAVYSIHRWSIPVDKIKLTLVYLNEKVWDTIHFTIDHLELIKSLINRKVNEIKSLLDDPVANLATADRFLPTTEIYRCTRCNFQEVCQR